MQIIFHLSSFLYKDVCFKFTKYNPGNNFSENIKLLREQYYNLYYLPSYEKFLEYPEEIIYKINQFYNEAEFNINNIKSIINIIHTNRIKYIIKSTNIVIKDFIKHHVNYIKTNINVTYIVDKYYLSKYAELDNLYNNCIKANSYVINDNIPFLDNQNYDEEMSINKKYINDFVSFLETTINNTFINAQYDDHNYKIQNYRNKPSQMRSLHAHLA